MKAIVKVFFSGVTIILLIAVAFAVYNDLQSDAPLKSGVITEKFRGGNNWVTTYHFVIDDTFDICIDEITFYQFHVNDTYSWR